MLRLQVCFYGTNDIMFCPKHGKDLSRLVFRSMNTEYTKMCDNDMKKELMGYRDYSNVLFESSVGYGESFRRFI